MTPIYEGKAKVLYPHGDKELAHHFKDSATAFNGKKKAEFPGKGELNSRFCAYFFKLLEKAGVRTHFRDWKEPNILIAERLQMIPLEVVVRNRVAGSLQKRMDLPEGTPLAEPKLEFFVKNDAEQDPQILESAILSQKICSGEELENIRKVALQVNKILMGCFEEKSLQLIDFKLEFGRSEAGELVLADEISPDTCRIWDAKTQEKLDKDRFRFDLGDLLEGYRKIWERL